MHFIVTTDRSEHSYRAFPHAARIARAAGAELTLLQVLNPRLDLASEVDPSLSAAAERVAVRWQTELEAVARSHDLAATSTVAIQQQRERTDDTVARVAGEREAALLIMDTRGSGKVHHTLVGSVATGVVGKSGLPVMLTREGMASPRDSARYRLLVTHDGSPAADAILLTLRPLLPTLGAEVTMLRAHELPAADSREIRKGFEDLRAAFSLGANVTMRLEPLHGERSAADAILAVAAEIGADAIAMATHGHSARRHLFAGSTAMDVLGRSAVPVIMAKAGAA